MYRAELPAFPRDVADGGLIKGVEAFRTGTWNGKKYDLRDLDAMVDAFNTVGFRPPITLGHNAADDAFAHGYVAQLYRKGDVLLADLAGVPAETVQAIRDGRILSVSAEIYFNMKRDGRTFPLCSTRFVSVRRTSARRQLAADRPAVGRRMAPPGARSGRLRRCRRARGCAPPSWTACRTLKREVELRGEVFLRNAQDRPAPSASFHGWPRRHGRSLADAAPPRPRRQWSDEQNQRRTETMRRNRAARLSFA